MGHMASSSITFFATFTEYLPEVPEVKELPTFVLHYNINDSMLESPSMMLGVEAALFTVGAQPLEATFMQENFY